MRYPWPADATRQY